MKMHMCISVRGVLLKSDRELVSEWGNGAVTNNGKECLTAHDIREAFFDELAQGREVVPFGKCDNFDYKAGCKGHAEALEEVTP